MRIAILPYGASDSVTLLRDELNGRGLTARRMRRDGTSTFRGRENDLVINWGNSNFDGSQFEQAVGSGQGLNPPGAIRNASLKTRAMRLMQDAGVDIVESTEDAQRALDWVNEGHGVYARTRLQGHSGEGIVFLYNSNHHTLDSAVGGVRTVDLSNQFLPQAPLYTKAVSGARREFRIHIVRGQVIFSQLKKRRNGYRDDPEINYSNLVRNHSSGWIYASAPSNNQPNAAAIRNAKAAVRAMGLDFGAVDVITNGDDAWVLEINTAPGLYGTSTLEAYGAAFHSIAEGTFEEMVEEQAEDDAEIMSEDVEVPELPEEEEQDGAFWQTVTSPRTHTIPQELASRMQSQTIPRTRILSDEELNAIFGSNPAQEATRTLREEVVMTEETLSRAQRRTVTPEPWVPPTPVPPAPPAPAPEPAAPVTPPPATPTPARLSTALVDGGLYRIEVSGESHYAMYESTPDTFMLIGYDIPLASREATVMERLR